MGGNTEYMKFAQKRKISGLGRAAQKGRSVSSPTGKKRRTRERRVGVSQVQHKGGKNIVL